MMKNRNIILKNHKENMDMEENLVVVIEPRVEIGSNLMTVPESKMRKVKEFYKMENIKALMQDLENVVLSQPVDLSTDKSRKAIATKARKVSSSKVFLLEKNEPITEEAKKLIEDNRSVRRYIEDFCDNLRDKARKPYTDWQKSEKIRQREIMENIEVLMSFQFFDSDISPTAELIQGRLDAVKDMVIDESYAEHTATAQAEKDECIKVLEIKLEAQLKHEADQAELVKLRKDAEERDRIDAERKAKEEADRIAKEEEEAKAKAEADAKVKSEQDEKDRISGIQNLFNRYYQRHSTMSNESITVEELNYYIKGLTGQLEDLSCFGEKAEEAQDYIASIIEDSTVKRDFKLKILEDQEEKERLAREEQIRKDAEAKAKREAEEKALADAKKADDEAKAREARIESDRLQAIKDKEAAEQREQDAIQAERERVAAEKAKQDAIDKAREEDEKNRAKVENDMEQDINAVLNVFGGNYDNVDIADALTDALINNKIRHTTIKY